jgi:hypothetical protein
LTRQEITLRTVVLIDSVLISQAAVIILSVCYGMLSSYLGKTGLASVCLSLSFVCALVHLFDVIKKNPYRRPSSYTRTGLKEKKRSGRFSPESRAVEVLSKIVKKKGKRKRKAQSGQNVITLSSVTTVPGRHAKVSSPKSKGVKQKMEIKDRDVWSC